MLIHGILIKLLHTTLIFINVKELRERANLKCLNYQQFTTTIRNKRAQRALGRSPEKKVKGQDEEDH